MECKNPVWEYVYVLSLYELKIMVLGLLCVILTQVHSTPDKLIV